MSERQRAHPRYDLASIDALVAGVACRVENVSAIGILIAGWGNPSPVGTTERFTLRTLLSSGVMSLDVTGTVVRLHDNGVVALNYDKPTPSWPRLLEFLDRKKREGQGGG